MTELRMGVYRHWKGPLYQVIGIAHDANSDGEVHGAFSLADPGGIMIEGRIVVVYFPLQLDGARPGPRMAVRTLEDFQTWVNPVTGEDMGPSCMQALDTEPVTPRFEYLGPALTADML